MESGLSILGVMIVTSGEVVLEVDFEFFVLSSTLL
jgi:hypothetical protein